MANKYNITDARIGAVGDHAVAHHFTLGSDNSLEHVDPAVLAEQLSLVRQEAMAEAMKTGTPADVIAAGKIAEAETAAATGDKEQAFASLKSSGKWALDIATKVGASLVANVLEKELGLK